MLNKKQIIQELNNFVDQYEINKSEIQVLGGASLVLRGLRPNAQDIDLYVNTETCKRLLNTGDFEKYVVKEDPKVMWVVGETMDMRDTAHECDWVFEGFNIQSLESILQLKLKLNRQKDISDIEMIKHVLSLA
ncbi:hypothetical protein AVU38_gp094 [Ralstonia phage RSL2]|uniref:Uncharacterized protein n=1 Tax=Ralstonia phage RSL2 TaxID=1585840 RepID=A0A0A8J8T3_9CAUD|nr:hypothetical protein AVU38_gp094 [Ralstonia phage RSL2]BAQ02622.1 hypothetical protein [Ralstonia phage RSL2]